MQVWKQEWAWSEAEVPHKLALRNSRPGGHLIASEPMFCVETCARCLLWSELVYKPDAPQVSCRSLLDHLSPTLVSHVCQLAWRMLILVADCFTAC